MKTLGMSVIALVALGCAPAGSSIAEEDSDATESPLTAAQQCAVVKLANSGSFTTLDDDAKLNSAAARNIVAHRAGPDGELGTIDDRWFKNLSEVDAVPQVGPAAIERMRNHAKHEGGACGDVPVQILAFNDFHGALEVPSGSGGRIKTSLDPAVAPTDAGGAEFLATHLKALEATNPNTVIVAAGDIIGATPLLSSAFHDEPTIESVNLMGLDVAAVGNHEFDEGIDELWRMQDGGCHPKDGCQDGDDFAGAAFPYLAANVTTTDDGETIFPSYYVKSFGNARVGFIGMTLENTPGVVTAAGVEGLSFADEADTANKLVPALQARGVEAIVVLIHEGGAATGLYNECAGISGPIFEIVSRLDPAIDIVVSGHTNAAHLCELDGRLVTSAAHNGRLVTDIDLVIDETTGQVKSAQAGNVIVTRTVEKDPAQTSLIAKYKALVASVANRVIGQIAAELKLPAATSTNAAEDNAMGYVIADAQLEATRDAGAQIAFMNPGGVRAPLTFLSSAGEGDGVVTYGELFAVQPFANNLVTVTLTGAQIAQVLEQQWLTGTTARSMLLLPSAGFSYQFDETRPAGSKVVPGSITLGGAPLDPATEVRVTLNAFLADGGDSFSALRGSKDRVGGTVDLDALERYLVAHTPVALPSGGRVVKVAPPQP